NVTGVQTCALPISFTIFIKTIAQMFHENYGLAIIIITLLIRLVLMPFMVKQMKSSMLMKEKMNLIKPDLDALKEKYKDKKDTESQREQQTEMMEIYKKHDMNPFSMFGGCLPLLIQMPILLGLYYAIR